MRKSYLLNIILAAVVGLASLAALLYRVSLPAAILPVVSLPAVAALVLLALVLECYLTKKPARRDWAVTGLLGALTFGLLPFGAGLTVGGEAVRLAAVGGAAFLILASDSSLTELVSADRGMIGLFCAHEPRATVTKE